MGIYCHFGTRWVWPPNPLHVYIRFFSKQLYYHGGALSCGAHNKNDLDANSYVFPQVIIACNEGGYEQQTILDDARGSHKTIMTSINQR